MPKTPGQLRYAEYLASDHWKNFRDTHRKRRTCPGCTRHRPLQLHHMIYRGDPKLTVRKDVMWLCGDCHKLFHEMFGLMAPAEQLKHRHKLKSFTKYQLRAELGKRGLWPHPKPPSLAASKKRKAVLQSPS